jgi:hypothetical protein
MADRLNEMIPGLNKQINLHTQTINAENGPECNGRLTQWIRRLVELSDAHEFWPTIRHTTANTIQPNGSEEF